MKPRRDVIVAFVNRIVEGGMLSGLSFPEGKIAFDLAKWVMQEVDADPDVDPVALAGRMAIECNKLIAAETEG